MLNGEKGTFIDAIVFLAIEQEVADELAQR